MTVTKFVPERERQIESSTALDRPISDFLLWFA